MDWLLFFKVLAIALQLADGAQTCAALRNGDVHEAWLQYGIVRQPPCGFVMAAKVAPLLPLFIVKDRRLQWALAATNAVAGGVGITLSVKFYWSRR